MKLQKQIRDVAMSRAIAIYSEHKKLGTILTLEDALQTRAAQEAHLFYADGTVNGPARFFKAPQTFNASELGEREEIEAYYQETFLFSYLKSIKLSGTTTYKEDAENWHRTTFSSE